MKIWIVWLPNVGKSTLFNALTKSYAADAQNFPFCTIDPNIWIVDVKDPRMDVLADISGAKKKVYAAIKFVDIAWLVRWASKWEGMWNAFLSHIRETDAIVQVLRHFDDSDVSHVEWEVDPMRDVEIINMELILSDIDQIERKLANASKKAKSKDKDAEKEFSALTKVYNALSAWKLAIDIKDDLTADEYKIVKLLQLLTFKPFVYAINVAQEDLAKWNEIQKEFAEKLHKPVAIVCAKMEHEMMEFDADERDEFLKELLEVEHLSHIPTLDDMIGLAFKTVGLMYYFTTGEKETRAWTIPIWSTAPQAAGAIHTDFERGFIKAEIVKYVDLVASGSWNNAKLWWKIWLQWKDYIVNDGDVIVFKFNV